MLSLSVIICSHQPREDYLRRVLEALRRQTLPPEKWEILLVDNGSTPALASTWDLSWQPDARHVREDRLGLTQARLRGIQEARGDLLVFVDDDNVLNSAYLETALALAGAWPQVGVFGGSQLPEFEQAPDDDIREHIALLAVRTIPEVLWTNIKGLDPATPRGAGLCIRRELAVHYARQVESTPLRKMLDRSGPDGLLSGGDSDMAWSVCDQGYGMLVTPALVLTHLIGKARLDQSYLIRIMEGHAASGILLAHLHNLPRPKSPLIDYAREALRIVQAPGLFHKKLLIAGLLARRRGYKILYENADI